MAGSRTLTRLEKKFLVLRQRQEAMQARYKAQLKETQRAIVDKRNELIVQTIRRMDFPTDKPVILIGALLEAKQRLEGPEKAALIDRYIALYNEFAAAYPNLVAFAEEAEEPAGEETEGKEEMLDGNEPQS